MTKVTDVVHVPQNIILRIEFRRLVHEYAFLAEFARMNMDKDAQWWIDFFEKESKRYYESEKKDIGTL